MTENARKQADMNDIMNQIERLQAVMDSRSANGADRTVLSKGDDQDEAWNPRVMLVDDDLGYRTMLRDWLADMGVTDVAVANDGAEAVELAGRISPDLILMDLRMPKMDGIEAARRIKARLPAVQVVMLSGYGDERLQRAAEEAGVYSYLVKGCPTEDLWHTLRFSKTFKRQADQDLVASVSSLVGAR
jgi:CheY-like chemotaxis protein